MKPLQLILATGTNEVETVLMDDILTSGHFLAIKRNFEKKTSPSGRVVSAANWQAWGLEFDSRPSQNFFFEGIKSFDQYIDYRFELNFNFNLN